MLKQVLQFVAKVGEKEGLFHFDHDTSLEAAKEMGFQFMKYLGQIEDAAKAQKAASSPEEAPPEASAEQPASEAAPAQE